MREASEEERVRERRRSSCEEWKKRSCISGFTNRVAPNNMVRRKKKEKKERKRKRKRKKGKKVNA